MLPRRLTSATFTNAGIQPISLEQALVLTGLLDDVDLTSGLTSSDGSVTISGSGGVYTITGTLAPGGTVTVVYSVTAKPYADQGDHNFVALVVDPANVPAGVPGSCTIGGQCVEVAASDTAAVPMVNPAVAGIAVAAVAVGGGTFLILRRRTSAAA